MVSNPLQETVAHFTNNDSFSAARAIAPGSAEKKLNIVLMSVESLSASFLQQWQGGPE